MTTDIKTRDQELAAATAHYMRTAADLFRAQERNTTHGAFEEFDRAAAADSAALDRLQAALEAFPKTEAARLFKDIMAARRKL